MCNSLGNLISGMGRDETERFRKIRLPNFRDDGTITEFLACLNPNNFWWKKHCISRNRKITFVQVVRKSIYYILYTHIKQVKMDGRKVSHVRDGRQKWLDRFVAGFCRHGPGLSGSLGYTGWRIVIAKRLGDSAARRWWCCRTDSTSWLAWRRGFCRSW